MNSLTLLCALLNAESALYTARGKDWTETNGHCFGVNSNSEGCVGFLDLPQIQLNELRKVTISICVFSIVQSVSFKGHWLGQIPVFRCSIG